MISSKALILLSVLASASAFQPGAFGSSTSRHTTSLNAESSNAVLDKIKSQFAESGQKFDADFDNMVKDAFPGALSNEELETRVVKILSGKGYDSANTLLCTSLCCDELARTLEDDFVGAFGNNFNLGGLAGFPFAGNTGFGAM